MFHLHFHIIRHLIHAAVNGNRWRTSTRQLQHPAVPAVHHHVAPVHAVAAHNGGLSVVTVCVALTLVLLAVFIVLHVTRRIAERRDLTTVHG